MLAKKFKLVECCTGTCYTGQFVQIRNSLILLYKFNIKLFLKKDKLYGHFLVTINRIFDLSSDIHVS